MYSYKVWRTSCGPPRRPTEMPWVPNCACIAGTSGSCRGTWRPPPLALAPPDCQMKEVVASTPLKTSRVWGFTVVVTQKHCSGWILKISCPSVARLLYFFVLTLQTHLQSQRSLLLQGTESLNNASQSIQRSQQIANETEQIGNDIIEELGEQREQLDRTRNRVRIPYTLKAVVGILSNSWVIKSLAIQNY